MLIERQEDLMLLLLGKGRLSVQDIAKSLGASLATVRRDLNELEKQGLITRSHGYAQITSGSDREIAFAAREKANIDAKRTIAAAAIHKIRPGETLFLDAGTTVLQLARHIRNFTSPVKVFTNGIVAAQELSQSSLMDVTMIGGRLRPENLSMVGPTAVKMMNDLWFDHLFLGATAIDEDGRLSSVDAEEAQINALMVKRSAKVTVLADASKFGVRSTHAVVDLNQAHHIIADQGAADRLRKLKAETGVDYSLAQGVDEPKVSNV